ncbi:hypothetical protein [Alloactinosynnema sp. L-07]|uniref:hypothetical protein n=1 Tax=Alloactinosynnema sp. L-07 TaxID=1653480 RepID=UPI00065EF797|nr:hypothetical protein [Alloactinosynnema sp. L-07]CRK59076.1 hypothetical protein [Alloactinosynnema sp. L-07]
MSEEDEQSTSQRFAEEVADEARPWPEDWPNLRPFIQLDRRGRADVMTAYATVLDQLPQLQGVVADQDQADRTEQDPGRPKANAGRPAWAAYAATKDVRVTKDMGRDAIIAVVDASDPKTHRKMADDARKFALISRVVADLVDALSPCANDQAAFTMWADKAPDTVVLSMFMRYVRSSQAPEASSSSS